MSRYRDALLFLSLAAVWGTAFVAIKAGLEFFPPVLFAALRYDVAGVVMLAYAAYVVDDPIPRGSGQWLLVGIGAVLLIAAYHAFLFVGQQHTTSSAAATVVSLSPVLTTGFARGLLPDERLSALGVAGLLLGLIGVGLIAQPDPENLLTPEVVGVGLIFAAAASFALGSVLTKRLDAGLPIEAMEGWSMLGGALLMHAISAAHPGESFSTIDLTVDALLALGYLAIISSAIGFMIYFHLLDRIGPIEINLVSYVAPVFAALFGWLLLGEVIDAATVAGFALIVVGFGLIKRRVLVRELGR